MKLHISASINAAATAKVHSSIRIGNSRCRTQRISSYTEALGSFRCRLASSRCIRCRLAIGNRICGGFTTGRRICCRLAASRCVNRRLTVSCRIRRRIISGLFPAHTVLNVYIAGGLCGNTGIPAALDAGTSLYIHLRLGRAYAYHGPNGLAREIHRRNLRQATACTNIFISISTPLDIPLAAALHIRAPLLTVIASRLFTGIRSS